MCEHVSEQQDEEGDRLGISARTGLPARGAEPVCRGCQIHQLMGAWGWGRGGPRDSSLGGGQVLSTNPHLPCPISFSPWLDKTFPGGAEGCSEGSSGNKYRLGPEVDLGMRECLSVCVCVCFIVSVLLTVYLCVSTECVFSSLECQLVYGGVCI